MKYAYHATNCSALADIASVGLQPLASVEGVLFFDESPELVDVYGGVFMRFPWPRDAIENFIDDAAFGYYSWYSVAPHTIEILINKTGCTANLNEHPTKWVPLLSVITPASQPTRWV
jgi:hypothetical protein